ncbi:MAG TPA: ATP-binding protein, partial [Solirubrobacterales bacterium]|nr:ATP-binding protein [Solirubrobacterales bacterium]
SAGARTQPTEYEIDLILNEVRHTYGVTFDSKRVLEEWAYTYPHGRAALLFHREGDAVSLGSAGRQRGRATIDILRPNALFLSTAAATNHPALVSLFGWFTRNLWLADVDTRSARQAFTALLLERPDSKDRVLQLLREADLGITGAIRREVDDPAVRNRIAHQINVLEGSEENAEPEGSQLQFADFEVRLRHQAAEGEVELSPEDESLGTLIWFGLAGPVLDALENGAVLLADELDASLHPALVQVLVQLFQSERSNPNRAQLIFNSHDITLMESKILGRDQIWFTEKRPGGDSYLYPLTDWNPRKGEAVPRRYLAGRYGATPLLSRSQLERIAEPSGSGE